MFDKYFEDMDHKHAIRNNKISMKLPKVKLETGQNGLYFFVLRNLMDYPPPVPEVRTIKFRTE